MKLVISSLYYSYFLLISATNASVLDWIWWSRQDDTENTSKPRVANSVTYANVPFEAKTDDEKFLEEAKKYTSLKLSDLDTCQHKVVMKIRSSCSELTEEELAKMSVNLLNCQSAIEGRQQFPCTESMALRECTSTMDSDMWNTYHLMSNRARAVCYAARHQEFRALSEMTVNKLMHTAHDQLQAMNALKEGQQKLESITAGTLESVAIGQESLLKQQERMRVTQQNLRDFVGLNLRKLTKEKALIAAGHRELSKMTEDVKLKLDEASAQLSTQSSERQANHVEILNDLHSIQTQANIIWGEIERSTQEILARHESAAAQYEDTLLKLAKINSTVTFLLTLMETTKHELDERLGWLGALVGATGIYVFVLHGLYLLVGMISTSFLQAPALTRLCLVGIVPLNLVVIYHHGKEAALDYSSMTMFIIASTGVHWLLTKLQACISGRNQIPAYYLYNRQPGQVINGTATLPTPTAQISFLSKVKIMCASIGITASAYFKFFVEWSKSLLSRRTSESSSTSRPVNSWDVVPDPPPQHEDESSDSDSSILFHSRPSETNLHDISSRYRDTGSPALKHRLPASYSFPSPPTPSRTASRSGTPLRSDTPRPLCRAVCRSGQACRNSSLVGSDLCRVHAPDLHNISLRDTF